ncbi:hypothetical protein GCM10027425_10790 [Alteromonas gracilis]
MPHQEDRDAQLSIGQLAEEVGVTTQLIRAWEARFDFPRPHRLASGHRRYSRADAAALRAVLEARGRGVDLRAAISNASTEVDALRNGSLFAGFAQRNGLQVRRLRKPTLMAMSWAIEDEILAGAHGGILIGTFQKARYFDAARSRWRDLAEASTHALAIADFSHHDDAAVPAEVALPAGHPLLREWTLVHESPSLAVALVAREVAGQGGAPERDRVFEAAWSFDGPVVRSCTIPCIAIAEHLGSDAAQRVGAGLIEQQRAPSTSLAVAHGVFSRAVKYMDDIVRTPGLR